MKRSPGIIAEQRVLTDALEARLAATPGTVEAPTVVNDPYGIAPLSALVCFSTVQEESFRVQLSDGQGRTYLQYVTPSATEQRIIVPALVNGEPCTFTAIGSLGTTLQLTLPAVQIEAPMHIEMQGAAPENMLLFGLPADGAGQPVAVNAFGALCWTLTLPLNHRLTFCENGHFLCGAPLQLAPPYSGTAIWEMDALAIFITSGGLKMVSSAILHCCRTVPSSPLLNLPGREQRAICSFGLMAKAAKCSSACAPPTYCQR